MREDRYTATEEDAGRYEAARAPEVGRLELAEERGYDGEGPPAPATWPPSPALAEGWARAGRLEREQRERLAQADALGELRRYAEAHWRRAYPEEAAAEDRLLGAARQRRAEERG